MLKLTFPGKCGARRSYVINEVFRLFFGAFVKKRFFLVKPNIKSSIQKRFIFVVSFLFYNKKSHLRCVELIVETQALLFIKF